LNSLSAFARGRFDDGHAIIKVLKVKMGYHAHLSPSSAHRWKSCTASIKHTVGMSDEGHHMSRVGTTDHAVAAECLIHDLEPASFLGREFWFCDNRVEDFADRLSGHTPKYVITIDQEHVDAIEKYVDYVRERIELTGGTAHIEQSVPVRHITGEEKAPGVPATGSSDVILVYGDTIEIIDAKFGHDRVWAYEVTVPERPHPITGEMQPAVIEPNDQMAMYASGSVEMLRLMYEFRNVKMTIVQPRVEHISEHNLTIEELEAHIATLRAAAIETRENPTYRPSTDNCKYCKGRDNCEARDMSVLSNALEGFETIADVATAPLKQETSDDYLGIIYQRLDEFEKWISDKRLRAYEHLLAGKPLVRSDGLRYKLVLGKSPARKWSDEESVATLMLGYDDILYKREMVSPTQIEVFSKEKRNRQRQVTRPAMVPAEVWEALQPFIFQGKPRPVIALETDPRDTADTSTVDFEEISDLNFFKE
jgi:Protein of unknown function (DUF2800)